MFRSLISALARFRRETHGTYAIEAVLIFPTLIWGGLATLTFVDGYRAQTLNLRTTYTMSDLLSRQVEPVGPDFINGLGEMYEFMTNGEHPTSLRVTVVYWNEPDDEHVLVWSDRTDGAPPPVTEATFGQIEEYIPTLANADTAIIVETWMDYTPPFDIGLGDKNFHNRSVVSPRFTPQLKWDPSR